MITNLDILILILPIAFAIHNLEEVFGMEKWTNSVPTFIHKPVTTRQFTIAIVIFTFLGFLIIFLKEKYQTTEQFLSVVSGFAGMLLLNVFFPHLIATIYLKRYAPGVITGLLINLPIASILLWKIYKSQKISVGEISLFVIIGGVIGIILAHSLLKIGKVIDEKMKKNKTTN